MNVSRMSDQGAVDTLTEICDALCVFVEESPEAEEPLLALLREEIVNDVEEEDGTITRYDTVKDFCKELKSIISKKPTIAKILLESMIEYVLNPLAEDDFFGTEGWEHRFGLD